MEGQVGADHTGPELHVDHGFLSVCDVIRFAFCTIHIGC